MLYFHYGHVFIMSLVNSSGGAQTLNPTCCTSSPRCGWVGEDKLMLAGWLLCGCEVWIWWVCGHVIALAGNTASQSLLLMFRSRWQHGRCSGTASPRELSMLRITVQCSSSCNGCNSLSYVNLSSPLCGDLSPLPTIPYRRTRRCTASPVLPVTLWRITYRIYKRRNQYWLSHHVFLKKALLLNILNLYRPMKTF